MDIKAKYQSNGFRKKFWEAGEIAENVTADELKMSEMKHFEPVGGGKIPALVLDEKPIALKELGDQNDLVLKTPEELKALLDAKGIKYHPRMGATKLIELLTGGGV